MTSTIDDEAEDLVRSIAQTLTQPQPGECLACYIDRMLGDFPCDGTLRFALAYRDASAPRATALARTLGNAGGFCDDEVLMNAYEPAARLWTRGRWVDDDGDEDDDGGHYWEESEPPEVMPACLNVRRGSTRPCALWERVRRGARRW